MTELSPEEVAFERNQTDTTVRVLETVGRRRRYATRVRSYLDGAERDPDGNLRPMREVAYECCACFATWMRMTAARIVAPEECPYCGGQARLKVERRYE